MGTVCRQRALLRCFDAGFNRVPGDFAVTPISVQERVIEATIDYIACRCYTRKSKLEEKGYQRNLREGKEDE